MPGITRQGSMGGPKKTGSVIDRIQDIKVDPFVRIMLYGKSGTGKTTLWTSFPDPILSIIVSGAGSKSGELKSVSPADYGRIKQVSLQQSSEVSDICDYVNQSNKFKTLVLDHVSGLEDMVLKEILGLEEIPAQKSWGMAQQQDYGQCTLQCKTILRKMLGSSCNVVIIGQERTFNTEGQEPGNQLIRPTVGVGAMPKLADWLNSAVDYACQTFIKPRMNRKENKVGNQVVVTETRGNGVDYCLRVEPHDVFYTKFRKPKGGKELPKVIVDPTYQKIADLLKS